MKRLDLEASDPTSREPGASGACASPSRPRGGMRPRVANRRPVDPEGRKGMIRMATKPVKQAETTERTEEPADSPILDSLTAPVRKMVARGKERGYRHLRRAQQGAAFGRSELRADRGHDDDALRNGHQRHRERGLGGEHQRRAAASRTCRHGCDGRRRRPRPHRRPRAHVSARDGQRRASSPAKARSRSPSGSRRGGRP